MNLLRFLNGLPDDGLHSGDDIEVLDDSGEVVHATYKGKGKHARGHVVVTYTQGRYTGIDQYVERERVVGLVDKQAEPVLAHPRGWNQMKEVRKDIAAAVLFTLATVGSASLYAGIVLVVSNNRATEFDLERLRKVCSEKESQAEFGDWMKQLTNSATAS